MRTSTITAAGNHRGLSSDNAPAFDITAILKSIPTLKQVQPVKERRKLAGKNVATASGRRNPGRSGLKNLAEAIILQSIEDLWSRTHQQESIEFFAGEGFRHCADMAGMGVVDRLRIMRLLRKVDAGAFTTRHNQKLSRIARSL